ncbi:MAG TPA: endonuclease/exonuclease/phosphatase family protein [bacterium]|nr:endonuclease/exonuclease/phosphatase family protein [bacterium]HQO34592.1 endonuclease/exonuclease/phosphatase family protein [bacterium]HQP97257.1 endonuclease/exonuclease/phosphatase family protein [bacterium]
MKSLISKSLFFLCLVGIGLTVSAQDQQSIQVMTFNIRYNNPNDGINAWPNRKDAVAKSIGSQYRVDLVGMQEVLKEQCADLEQRLPDYAWIGVGRDDGKEAGEFCPIFYRKERFDLLDHATFWLSETPEIAGKKGWDAACNRVVTWGKFKDRRTQKEFYHFNTHFDHRGETARIESAKLIWQRVMDIAGKTPAIVTGDLNTRENSTPYAILTGKEPVDGVRSDLRDARYASVHGHEGPTSTFSNWTEIGEPETKIDYIFLHGNIRALRHRVLTDRIEDRFLSDHLPVLAEIEVP